MTYCFSFDENTFVNKFVIVEMLFLSSLVFDLLINTLLFSQSLLEDDPVLQKLF